MHFEGLDGTELYTEVCKRETLQHTKGWIRETLRMHAIVPGIHRMTAREVQFGEWVLPRGVIAAPSSFLLHRRAPEWGSDDLDDFRADRTFPEDGPYFIPFGARPHKCLASQFGFAEVGAMVALTVAKYSHALSVSPAFSAKTVRRGVTLAPSDGFPLVKI